MSDQISFYSERGSIGSSLLQGETEIMENVPKKKQDLMTMKTDALNQKDKFISLTQKVHELEDLKFFLTKENEFLTTELSESRDIVKKSEANEAVLHNQISDLSTKLARLSIIYENERVAQMSNQELDSKKNSQNFLFDREVKENQQRAQSEIRTLRDKLTEQDSEMQRRNKEIRDLRQEIKKISELNFKLEKHSEVVGDSRSKSELLEIIRKKMEEKIYWESYAEILLKLILANNKDLLDTSIVRIHSDLSPSDLVRIWNDQSNKGLR